MNKSKIVNPPTIRNSLAYIYSKGTFLGLKEVHTWRMLENSSKIKFQTFPIFLIPGVGDKGYQTLELRLVGPILAVTGALLVCCRVLMCFIVII